ncbi:MAG: ATP-binding protein [Pseudomonadota bacterium]
MEFVLGRRNFGWQQTLQTLAALAFVSLLLLLINQAGYHFSLDSAAIDTVDAQKSDTPEIAKLGEEWQSLNLPYRLCKAPVKPCYENYRVVLPDHYDSIFLRGFAGSLTISLNGKRVHQVGTMKPPIERILFRPVFVHFPEELRDNADELIITVGSDRRHFNRLHPFYFGTKTQLEPVYQLSKWLAVDLLIASSGIYVVLGFLSLLTFWLARDNPLFFWFGLIVLHAAARNLFFLWTDPAWDYTRGLIYFQATFGMLVAAIGFTGTLVHAGSTRLYGFLYLVATLVVIGFGVHIAIDNYEGAYLANMASRALSILAGVWTLWRLSIYLLGGWHFVKPWVFSLFVGAFMLTMHDVFGGTTGAFTHLQLSNLAPLLLVMAFCFILAQQFSEALHRVQAHNAQLSLAVQQKESDLHAAYVDIRRAEQDQVINSERLRILQDVHDGVGGRLAGLVLMARRQGQADMASQLEESLQDLRVIIDSLDDSVTQDLAQAFSIIQSRWHNLFTQQGIELNWQCSCPANLVVTPQWLVSIMRGLQECLNNVVRHAQASQVIVKITVNQEELLISVSDNGVGLTHIEEHRGRGLTILENRVKNLQGHMTIDSNSQGTVVTLKVPIANNP